MKYQIQVQTNGYQASRNGRYKWRFSSNGATAHVETFDTLIDANMRLLDLFNSDYGRDYNNWGLAKAHKEDCHKNKNGAWGYHFDGYYYEVVEIDESELQRLLIDYSVNDVTQNEIEAFLGYPIDLGDFQHEAPEIKVVQDYVKRLLRI